MPKPSKYNELFSSDIFNLKENGPPQPQRVSLIAPSNNTMHDIFPSTSNNPNPPMRKNRSRDHLHSDIFFTIAPKEKANSPIREKITKSTVFSDCHDTDYKVKRTKVESNYKPENYVNFEEPNAIRHAKNFYYNAKREEPFQPDCPDGRIRGYYANTEKERNNSSGKIEMNPNKKRCLWNYKNSSGVKFLTKTEEEKNGNKYKPLNKSSIDEAKAKMNRINELQSNIFNDPTKKNFKFNDLKKKDNPVKSNEPDPKKIKCVHTKWPKTKFYWLNAPTELMFKKFDDNKEKGITAFNRKQKELTNSINVFDYAQNQAQTQPSKMNNKSCDIFSNPTPKESQRQNKKRPIALRKNILNRKNLKINVNDNTEDINRIQTIVRTTSPNMKEDKVRKYMDLVSSVGFDKDFYQRNLGPKALDNSKGNEEDEKQFEINNTENKANFVIDDLTVKRLLHENGIHAYDVNITNDGLSRDVKYNFKVRENAPEENSFEDRMDKACKKIQKEKGISIEPVQKICVNKRKTDISSGKEIWDGGIRQNPSKKNKREIRKEKTEINFNRKENQIKANDKKITVKRIEQKPGGLKRSFSCSLHEDAPIPNEETENNKKDTTKVANGTGNKTLAVENIKDKTMNKPTQMRKKEGNNVGKFMKDRFSNQFVKVDTMYKNNMGFIPMNRPKGSFGMFI